MLRHLSSLLVLCLLVATSGAGQARLPYALSAEDRQLVSLVLNSQERRWSNGSTVLLDSTRSLCETSVPDCVTPVDDLIKLAPRISPECVRLATEIRILRAAFLNRNVRTWELGELETNLVTVPGLEVRGMSTDTLVKRFPGKEYVEVTAPGYTSDGRFALVYVIGFGVLPGGWQSIQVLERNGAAWAPTGCGLNITA